MDELKRKPMRDFTEVTDIADTARIIGLQDNENVRIPLQSLIAKTLSRVDEDILTVNDINVEGGVTGFNPIGEVKQGDNRAVSGESIINDIFDSGNKDLCYLLINKGKKYPFKNYFNESKNVIRFQKTVLDMVVYSDENFNYTLSLLARNHETFGNRIDVRKKRKTDNATVFTYSFRTLGDSIDNSEENTLQLNKLSNNSLEKLILKSNDNSLIAEVTFDLSELLQNELINMYNADWTNFALENNCVLPIENLTQRVQLLEQEVEQLKENKIDSDTLIKASNWQAKKDNRESFLRNEYQEKISNNPNYVNQIYGIEWNENHSDPTQVVRKGIIQLHKDLPIQSKIRRCVVKKGIVQYYLDAENSTLKANGELAKLDGTDGDVMVEIPEFFYKANQLGAGNTVKELFISLDAIPDFKFSQKHYISAYRATVKRDTNSLSSVCTTNFDVVEKELFIENSSKHIASTSGFSLGTQKLTSIIDYTSNASNYRGNVNDATLDSENNPTSNNYARNNLGRPLANVNRTDAKKYAKNGGNLIQQYDSQKALYMLIMVEYATRQIQAPILPKSSENLTQGGLGLGATQYPYYEGYEHYFSPQGGTAVMPVGMTNVLGNNSGQVYFEIKNVPVEGDTNKENPTYTRRGNIYMPVMSYRGVEDFYGQLYNIVDNITTVITTIPGGGGNRKNEYYYQPNPYLTTDTDSLNGYSKIVESTFVSSIKTIKNLHWGENADILPIGVNDPRDWKVYYCDCVENVTGWNGNLNGTPKYMTWNGRAVSNELVGLLFCCIAVDVLGGRSRTSDSVRLQMF